MGLEVPGGGNCFLHAVRFALLQLHGWNYDLVWTQEEMRDEVCAFLRGQREMLDVNGMRLDDVRLAFRDPRPIPQGSVVLDPPKQDFYDSWDQWVDEMEQPSAYTD